MRAQRSVLGILAGAALLVSALSVRAQAPSQGASSPLSPPAAPVRPVIDDYFGVKIPDPYRYMENLEDPEVAAWMKAQNDYTRAELSRIDGRQRLLARISELDQSIPRVDATRLPGDLYMIFKTAPGESVTKIYLRRGLYGDDRLLLDPEKINMSPPNAVCAGLHREWDRRQRRMLHRARRRGRQTQPGLAKVDPLRGWCDRHRRTWRRFLPADLQGCRTVQSDPHGCQEAGRGFGRDGGSAE